jgi:hypothetical protein
MNAAITCSELSFSWPEATGIPLAAAPRSRLGVERWATSSSAVRSIAMNHRITGASR